ncbi:glycosyltransferase family 2 protein [Dyadobacter sp. Leaf189]|uniref:glycosyltransferase family 2 protein n=1 Tax=Dyadobacter sp. Leaf189 TaxID=1736295 RepID=UPI0006FB1EEE|nr:glycosyltransferase family 2 protein [Dyadobacter sp. Leaf189]KQS30666.1 LPS biosynthesis protein [Dyadobacter sp. Leaf189]
MKIAVLLTTYNRKDKTLGCLKSLYSQDINNDVELSTFLTDDLSSDGTAEAVKQSFPQVQLLKGTGTLFWAGGMRKSWRRASEGNFDYYLLVNDDTILFPDALDTLLKCAETTRKKFGAAGICIGSTMDAVSQKISYGGKKLTSHFSIKSVQVFSSKEAVECDLGNANIMLVPAQVVQKVGILSDHFTHGIADYDYTLKAKKAGFSVVVAPGVLGECTDDHGNNWRGQNTTLSERIKYLMSPKGLAYHEYLGFIRDHFPVYYPFAFSKLWLKTLFPFIWENLKARPN